MEIEEPMTLVQLIARLTELNREHGDLPVSVAFDMGTGTDAVTYAEVANDYWSKKPKVFIGGMA